jgi:hypothetical protein
MGFHLEAPVGERATVTVSPENDLCTSYCDVVIGDAYGL